jgi:hypothetical protein
MPARFAETTRRHAKRKHQPAARGQVVGPPRGRARRGKVDVDAIDGVVRPIGAVALVHGNLRPAPEVVAGRGGKAHVVLDGDDAAAWPGQFGENGRVIAGAGADVQDALARPDGEMMQHEGMQ